MSGKKCEDKHLKEFFANGGRVQKVKYHPDYSESKNPAGSVLWAKPIQYCSYSQIASGEIPVHLRKTKEKK